MLERFDFQGAVAIDTSTPVLRRDATATTSSGGNLTFVENVEHFPPEH